MYVQDLSVTNYRNITRGRLALQPGTTVLVGSNGQGKTNALESIEYAATLRSHRVASDAALVKSGEVRAHISALFRSGNRRSAVDVTIESSGSNRVLLNGQVARRRMIAGQFPVIVFSPRDLALVAGEPAERRDFLDGLLIQLKPSFSDSVANYARVLKQRNALLKSARIHASSIDTLHTLDDWDDQLVQFGLVVMRRRAELVQSLSEHVAVAYRDIAQTGEAVAVAMDTTVAMREDIAEAEGIFRETLRSARAEDLDRGVTTVGPHRDDLSLRLSELTARGHASHGESWSLALSLRLAAARLVQEISRVGDPIVMLDDVFAELDRDRRDRLGTLVADFEQTVITAAVAEELPSLDGVRMISVRGGEIGGSTAE